MKNLLEQLIVLLIFAYLPTSNSSTTCLPTVWGVYYTGTVSKTRGGLPCQRWDAHAPHKHSYGKDAFFPYDGGIKGANNFCRNPRGKSKGVWCYTMMKTKAWDYCNVPACPKVKKDCKPDTVGKTYKGTVRVTKSGRPCQYWSAQYPHRYRYIKYALFPEKKLRLAKNYCRNPTGKPGGPWCFTAVASPTWEYCDIPVCPASPPKVSGKPDKNPSMCLPTEYGVFYTGGVSKTRSGLTCQRWDAQVPHKHSYNKKKYFPDGDYKKAANFCRNPGGKKTGVWCYTTDKKKTWDYCKVTLCTPQKKDCKVDTRGKVYVGTVSVTKSGKPCQHWASQFPHAHPYAKKAELFPDVNLGLAKNYCRNPTNDPHGPWCITATASTVKEYCDIPICPQGPNLAFRKPTFQMDTYPGGESRKAVDGNKATDFAAGSCTRTNMKLKDKDNMNWWAVDLKKRYTINKVTLFNRGDCCGQRLANFDIVVVDTRPVPNLTLRYLKNQICAHQKGAVRQGKVGTYTCEKLVKGRYVAVVQARTEYLTLCEVEVFGTAGK